VGANGGDPDAAAQAMSVSAKIDRFADPEQDYINVVAVFNDDPNGRYSEIYVNGNLAARVDGPLGLEQSLQWDGYDRAGLGNIGGNELGGSSGTGDLPFSGGFQGDISLVRFRNHAISSTQVASNYNSMLGPVNFSVAALGGDAETPPQRPTNLSLGETESSNLIVVHERADKLNTSLPLDAIISGGLLMDDPGDATPGQLAAGTNFSSFLLQFDPLGSNSLATESVTGSIEFEEEILGILFESASLGSSDPGLASIGDYGSLADRGLALGAEGMLDVSSDRKTLSFSLSLPGNEMLQFRVLTELTYDADLNGDGFVDGLDLGIQLINWGQNVTPDQGELSGSPPVDSLDLGILLYTWNPKPLSTATVPEPSSLVLSSLASAAMMARRRRT
jgi:hypothetical protein